jgi:hypothetical protein
MACGFDSHPFRNVQIITLNMPIESKSSFGSGINAWAKEINKINPTLSSLLYEDGEYKTKNLKMLEELNLPHFKTIILSATDFLNEPEKVFSQLKYDRYFVNLIDKNGERQRELGIDRKKVISWLNEKIISSNINNYNLLISECPKQPYNGVLVIKSKQSFYLEMIKGTLPDLVNKNISPDYILEKKEFQGIKFISIKKDLDFLRTKTLNLIRQTDYFPGYYEFTLAQIDSQKENLSPFFFEYSNKKTYQLP